MKTALLLILAILPSLIFADYFRVCYVTNWSQYRKGIAKYVIKDHYISGLCTHLLFAFGKIVEKSNGDFELANFDPSDFTVGYPQTQKWKDVDPNLKTMLSVGGYTFGSKIFSKMVRTEAARRSFITQSVTYLKKYGFDGLDIDWEFPAKREGSSQDDKPNLTKLCKEMKEEYAKHGLLVSAAVIAETHGLEKSYDVAGIFKHLDFVNLMAYDLHGPWEPTANHHTDTNPDLPSVSQSMDNTINKYIELGAVPEKIVLGLAAYGKVFELDDECGWKMHSSLTGEYGTKGEFTGESGLFSYYEICRMKMEGRVCTKKSQAFAPYASKGTDFINYDDEESIQLKVNRLVKRKGKTHLKGIMIWALDFDDFNNVCNTGKYPLWQAAIDALDGKEKTYDTCVDKEKSCVATTLAPSSTTGQYNTGRYTRACFITNWAQYRPGNGKFDVAKHYEHGLCSHLFYAFAKVEEKDGDFKVAPYEWNDMSYGYPQTKKLKLFDPKLKTLLSIGGSSHNVEVFVNMIKTSTNRNNLITNAAKFITSQGFDGLDFYFSWEWPNPKKGSTPDDKENFGKLIKEMKAEFSKVNLLLTVTVVHPEFYDLTELSKNVDMINIVQTFKLRQAKDDKTGHPAPMSGSTSVLTVVESLIKRGVDPGKLNLGIATSGQTSELSKPCEWNLGSSTNEKGGEAGQFTRGTGTLAYYEICSLNWKNHVCTKLSPVKAPYGTITATKNENFVAYEDQNSISEKIKDVVMQKNLNGVAFWSLELDDFSGTFCSKGKYPLVKSAIKTLQGKPEDGGCARRHTCGDAPEGVKPSIDPNRYYRICYFTNWAQYRSDEAKFDITKNYEAGLCTHIFYAFAKVEGKDGKYKLAPYEWNDITTEYKKVTDLTGIDHNLKILLSVGGANHKSTGFTEMAKTAASRTYFITEAWQFLTKHKFSGLDIDWEYPGRRNGNPEDKENFVKLLTQMKSTFELLNLMLTVTVDGKTQEIDTSYDVAEISKTVDFINVNTYNYVSPKDNYTAHHTDSRGVANIVANTPSATIDAWIAKGAPADKLVLGLSGWARTQKLTGICEHKLGSKTKGVGGRAGYYTKSSGFMAYYETCRMIWESRTCTGTSSVEAPYGSTKIDFISYDDPESIALKLKEIMIKKQLRGFSFWSLDLDDFWQSCKTGTYPLLKAAKEIAIGFDEIKKTCQNRISGCFTTTTSTTSTTTIAPKVPETEPTTTSTTTTEEQTTTTSTTTTPTTTTERETTSTTTTERETTTEAFVETTPETTTTTQTTTTTPGKPVVTFPPLPDVDNTYSRVCFFTDTARERDGIASFDILQRYESDLCTHLIYTDGQIVQLGFGNIIEFRVPGFQAILHKLKSQDRRVKMLLGVGKDKVTIDSLKVLMNKPDVRKRFIQHAAIYLREYGFDGLNILWDPPTSMPIQLKYRFTSLCNELKSHFQSRQLLITASLSAQIVKIDHSYEVDKISRSLDMINIMTYDYYDNQNPFAAHHTDARESTSLHDHKIDNTITHLINRGAIARKLILGLSTFAKTWDLKRPERFWNLGSSVFVGGGQRGKFTDTRGMLAYYEVCRKSFKNHVCTASSEVKAPYGSDGETFIGYDDPISIKYKIDNFVLTYGMKGFMISNIDYDDFSNFCKQGRFPLLKAARDAARNIQRNTYNCTEVRTTLPPPTTDGFKNKVTLPAFRTPAPASAAQCSYNLLTYLFVIVISILTITLF